MIGISAKLAWQQAYKSTRLSHWCPGCEHFHLIAIGTPFPNGAVWTWDENTEAPTITPSVNVGPGTKLQCHYFIRSGNIQFLPDCHHALRGQTVPLPDLPSGST